MTDDFSKQPISITEARATREKNGSLWTARDALIETLREIDNGRRVDAIFLAIGERADDGGVITSFKAAGAPDRWSIIGLLECAKAKFFAG